MVAEATTPERATRCPEAIAAVLADYERHLVSERDLTPHTVRAYLA